MNNDSVSSDGILMKKQQIPIIIFALWLTVVSIFMLYFQQLDIEIFFSLGLIGFLVIVLLIEPNYIQPSYMQFIWYIITIGIMIFVAIIIQKVMIFLGFEIIM
jgi:hypothetical protein